MQKFTVESNILNKCLNSLGVDLRGLEIISLRVLFVALFIAAVPGIESFTQGFFDGLAAHR